MDTSTTSTTNPSINSLTNKKHRHDFKESGNYLLCECGKKKLKLSRVGDSDIYTSTKSDGTSYTVRANRDRIFTPDEWDRFFSKLLPSQTFTFKFLILTGARIMEAQHVKINDIDFRDQRITFSVTKQRGGDNVKNKSKTRTIRVSRELIKDINKQRNDKNLDKEHYLGILSQPAAHLAMKKALKEARVKDWEMLSIHSIRKTSENWALSIGVDSMKLSKRFGHSIITQYENYSQSDAFSPREKEYIKRFFGDTFIE